ncbi:acetyl-CoA carboxylase biotin carboxyl carrier protein subunit [Candidatus Woesearchaeota archaeon]|nr:MAG: acetyl-CoA carboxylase biotin carboxyl carrier protein subunit [Candidatus Woesearchaeota archaeon]
MSREYIVRVEGKEYTVKVTEITSGKFKVIVDGYELEVEAPFATGAVSTALPAAPKPVPPAERVEKPKPVEAEKSKPVREEAKPAPPPMPEAKPEVPKAPPTTGTVVEASVPGKVLKVLVKPGQRVSKTTVLLTLESMKMELEVYPPKEGVVKEIRVKPGDFVNAGDVLAVLE